MAISTAPAVEPAMMERSGEGLSGIWRSLFGEGGGCEEILGGAEVVIISAVMTAVAVVFALYLRDL